MTKSDLAPLRILAFAGHRPGNGPGRGPAELDHACRAFRTLLADLKSKAESKGERIELLTGVAEGSDLGAAETASELGVPVHIILPLPERVFAEDFGPASSAAWARAQALIARARAGTDGWTLRVASTSGDRPACYHEASHWMLQASDLLITVWNGLPAEGLGGTQETLLQARRMGLHVVQIDPASGGRVTHHPAGDDGEPLDDWPPADANAALLAGLIAAERQAHGPDLDAELNRTATLPFSPTDRAFVALDSIASRTATTFRRMLKRAIALHFVAALLAAVNASFTPFFHGTGAEPGDVGQAVLEWVPIALTAIECALVTVALGLLISARRARLATQWREARFGAEMLRGIRAAAGLTDPLLPSVQRHAPQARRFALAHSLAAHRHAANVGLSWEALKQRYLKDRIEDQRDRYFRKKHPEALHRLRRLQFVAGAASALAPPLVACALFAKLFAAHWVHAHWLGALEAYLLPIALPLIAGAATSMLIALDAPRRSERYRRMAERLDLVATAFPGANSPGAVAEAVRHTEGILLEELMEWEVVAKTTGH